MKRIPILFTAILLLCRCAASPEIEISQLAGNEVDATVATLSDDGRLIAVGYGKRISPTLGKPSFIGTSVKIYSSQSNDLVAELIAET